MKIKLKNRLDVLMRDSGVRSVEEMAQRLTDNQKYKITRTPLSRKFKDEDVTLSLSMIEAICNELQCLPGDLFETEVSDATDEYIDELRSRLQPFRYGSIRLKKPGAPDSTDVPATGSAPAPRAAPAKGKKPAAAANDLDDIAGPKVTHMNAAALKKQ
ncbi:helix-turn-helix domain-containing protein [Roseateles puraquae]|uniref:Cro/Cl family transcriptional regulator n=2 Tax=Pseudomonadota TaxID=1224 RepID=A0A254N0W1_9BURK|nr:helix-turn-helix transcriptional regulator [Roseateles puraquae]MDG0856812.1 XRE family transcriptional regulator [Roseateles puraquae]OWR01916.1 Cro/Cl family transcriptional regulator [Roseateles puraquae]